MASLECVRRVVWGVLYADNASFVSRSPQGLAMMMTIIREVFAGFCSTVRKKTETLLMRVPENRVVEGAYTIISLETGH